MSAGKGHDNLDLDRMGWDRKLHNGATAAAAAAAASKPSAKELER